MEKLLNQRNQPRPLNYIISLIHCVTIKFVSNIFYFNLLNDAKNPLA
jgi:hypothetical protein